MARQQLSDLDFGNVTRIQNLPAPVGASEPVRLQDLQSQIEGLAWKDNVRVASVANINLSSPGASLDGVTLVVNDRVLIKSQTLPAENGLYIFNGAAVAMTRSLDANASSELLNAITSVDEGTANAGTTWRQTAVAITLGTTGIAFSSFGQSAPAASTSTAGVIQIATQAQVDAGAATNLAVVPSTLAAWANRKLKFVQSIGDGSSTQIDVTHNLGTADIEISVFNVSTGAEVNCDMTRFSTNVARFNFSAAPAASALRVVIVG